MLLLSLAGVVAAQSAATPSDLIITKQSWSKERIGWERDPFGPTLENYDDVRLRIRNERRLEQARQSGNKAEASRLERLARAEQESEAERTRQGKPPRYAFLYKITVRNTGAKVIKLVDWDYVFLDAETQAEVGRHAFTHEGEINPGKSRELSVMVRQPPARTVSVYDLNKKERETLAERIEIMRVQYADGSVWEGTPK